MKIYKLISIMLFILFTISGNNMSSEKEVVKTNLIKESLSEKTLKDDFKEKLDSFSHIVDKDIKDIENYQRSLDNNTNYLKNLKDKTKRLKEEISEEYSKKIIQKTDEKLSIKRDIIIKYDSMCIEERGFIGNKVFGKNKCKEWKVEKYYINRDSIKVFL